MLQTHDDSVNPSSAPELNHGVIKKLSHLDRDECLHRIEPDSQFQVNDRSPLIRFQSRVRISSGVPRTGGDTKADNLSVISHSSSLASSPAPSIYAPLRSESDDEHSRWGSLGRRVNGSGVGKKKDRKLRETTERGRQMQICQYRRYGDDKQGQHERTPLIGHTVPSTHELQNMVGGVHDVEVRTRQSGDEIDLIFGTWPRRLINRYVCFLSFLWRMLTDIVSGGGGGWSPSYAVIVWTTLTQNTRDAMDERIFCISIYPLCMSCSLVHC
ncbi:hypothetical protein JOM56_006255 [Amanita muscaria]